MLKLSYDSEPFWMETPPTVCRSGYAGQAQCVLGHHFEPVLVRRQPVGDRARQLGSEHRVDLDGDDAGHLRQQTEGQRAKSRPHLDNDVVRAESGRPHDAPYRVGVDDEVLPERLRRPQLQPPRELPDVGSSQQRVRHLQVLTAHRPRRAAGAGVQDLRAIGLLAR